MMARNSEFWLNKMRGRPGLYRGVEFKGEGCEMRDRKFGNEKNPRAAPSENLAENI